MKWVLAAAISLALLGCSKEPTRDDLPGRYIAGYANDELGQQELTISTDGTYSHRWDDGAKSERGKWTASSSTVELNDYTVVDSNNPKGAKFETVNLDAFYNLNDLLIVINDDDSLWYRKQ